MMKPLEDKFSWSSRCQ